MLKFKPPFISVPPKLLTLLVWEKMSWKISPLGFDLMTFDSYIKILVERFCFKILFQVFKNHILAENTFYES